MNIHQIMAECGCTCHEACLAAKKCLAVSSADVLYLPCITTLDQPPDRVLGSAVGQVSSVIVIGRTPAGALYFASSVADGANVLWLIEKAKTELLQMGGV